MYNMVRVTLRAPFSWHAFAADTKVSEKYIGVEGFEPPRGGTKNRCLTAWLHPSSLRNKDKSYSIPEIICKNKKFHI